MITQLQKIRRIFSRKDKIIFCVLLMCMLAGALTEMLGVGAIPAFVALLVNADKALEYPLVKTMISTFGLQDSKEILFWGCWALIIIYLIKNCLTTFNVAFQAWFTKSRMVMISSRVFSSYMLAPYHFHLSRNSAELLRNTEQETRKLANQIIGPLLQIFMHGMITLVLMVFLFVSEPFISLLVIGLFVFISLIFFGITQKKVKKYGKEELKERKNTIKAIQQGLGSLKEASVLNREHFFIEKFTYSTIRRAVSMRFKEIVTKSTQPFMESMAVSGLLLITIYLVVSGRDINSILPTLALFTIALTRLRGSIGNVVSSFMGLRYNLVSVDPIYRDLMSLEASQQKSKSDEDFPIQEKLLELKERLSLEELYYRYPGAQNYALTGINITIPQGSFVGFVGSTGAGKTTIIDVILGLLVPEKGRVCVDQNNILKDVSAWQNNIGYIPQSIYLLDDTIKRNIALGVDDNDISEEKLNTAMQAAQIAEFVNHLPKGADTMTGERGVRISGGQRQRIGIARALYHNPKVLIMDEATSALDNATERLVMQALNNLKKDRTIIIIAHRLTTVQGCDWLYFMKNGRIQSSGTYSELFEQSSEFRAIAQAL